MAWHWLYGPCMPGSQTESAEGRVEMRIAFFVWNFTATWSSSTCSERTGKLENVLVVKNIMN